MCDTENLLVQIKVDYHQLVGNFRIEGPVSYTHLKVITMSGKEVEFIPLLVSALKQEGIADPNLPMPTSWKSCVLY